MAQELEIKLSVAQPDLDRAVDWLLGQPNTYESGTLQLGNTYYDTPSPEHNSYHCSYRFSRRFIVFGIVFEIDLEIALSTVLRTVLRTMIKHVI